MAKIAELVVNLRASTASFATDLAKANQLGLGSAKQLEASFRKISTVFAGIGTAAVGMGAAMVLHAGKGADEMMKLSHSVGVNIETLSSYSHAAKLSGLDVQGLAQGLGQLAKNAFAGDTATSKAGKAFQRLGVNVRDAHGQLRPASEVILDIAEKFSRMEDGSTKTALAMQIFGKSGRDMINFLNLGREGLKAASEEARALGIVIDEKTGRAAEEFNDNLERLEGAVDGFSLALMRGALPALIGISAALVDTAKQSAASQKDFSVLSDLLRGIATAGIWVAATLEASGTAIGVFGRAQLEAMRGNFQEAITIAKYGKAQMDEIAGNAFERTLRLWQLIGAKTPPTTKPPAGGGAGGGGGGPKVDKAAGEIAKSFQKAQEAAAAYDKQLASIADTLRQSWDPTIEAAAKMEELNQAFVRTMISGPELSRGLQEIRAELAALNPTLIAQHEALVKAEEDWSRYQQSLDAAGKSLKESLQTPAENATARLRELTVLLGTGRIEALEYSKGTLKIRSELKEMSDSLRHAQAAAEDFAHIIGTAFEDAMVSGRGLGDVLKALLQDIERIILRVLVTKPLENWLTNLFGNLLSSYSGGGAGSSFPSWGGGAQAGGPVSPGHGYLVGEAGPELFLPNVSGAIVSNRHIGGDRIVNLNYTIDARGADPTVDMRLRRMLREVHRDAIEKAQAGTRDRILRSGG